ncbi:thiamine biosynthesis adenylyltransferase ThiF [Anopheles sinensis]|uniref:Thiamine biosynthesis adenylyltransferase ThiF n=1 Tax=Anopheles sinensis TaxID=74873 RepID=A0A084W0R5_ANOSI|nr:thiamine biosynthesis adenylyltransferase ThiF [Anopheles sinensis]
MITNCNSLQGRHCTGCNCLCISAHHPFTTQGKGDWDLRVGVVLVVENACHTNTSLSQTCPQPSGQEISTGASERRKYPKRRG